MALSDLTASAGEAVAGRIAREWRVNDSDVLVRIRDAVDAAVSAERERCARVADEWAADHQAYPALPHAGNAIADAIRNRSK